LDGELLAWECEAHTGLHLHAEHAVAEAQGNGGGGELVLTSLAGLRYPMLRMLTGLVGRYAEGLCECGEKSGRVILSPCMRTPPAVGRESLDFASQGALAR
jgi:phenylacetate-coenzyme A ligase PaaK-like adenylate-forming protein